MNVWIDMAVFAHEANTMQLDGIAYLALVRRHRVIVDDDRNPVFVTWLERLSTIHREQWETLIKDSYLRESLEPARYAIRVTDAEVSDWDCEIPKLILAEAANYLALPFRILVEDAASDRSFLLSMATDEQKTAIQAGEDAGLIAFEHGGGIGTMARQVTAIGLRSKFASSRNFVIFDSDALQPGMPSRQSEILCSACRKANIGHHQLLRRSIENYLPKTAVKHWTFRRKRERQHIFDALLALSDLQRYHYNYKRGFNGDANHLPPAAGTLYEGLAPEHRAALADGLETNIAELFIDGSVAEADLVRDGGWSELNAVVTELIAIMR